MHSRWEAAWGGEFVAKFFLPGGVDFYCGGSLVGGRGDRVLSAAHCFEGADVSADVVRVGGVALFDGFQVKIKAVVLHPDYDPVTLENDLAVVTLAGMPPSKELRDAGVYPAQLNRVGGRPWAGEEVTHTGWGETSATGGGTTVAAELAATRMRVSAHADCIAYLDGRGWDTAGLDRAHLLCASPQGRGAGEVGVLHRPPPPLLAMGEAGSG
ncbi:hypothetical protein I4F81_000389 [Pyropia yezoensis]|uniref:Uncharacterized protein n=1 Tax=Pyropia yezoensis TaxID=2788 RepID=A0ACC3BIK2_PYRYE|nr:hypothetical protein I4F81_000389 [Neopyropia yezoensis]